MTATGSVKLALKLRLPVEGLIRTTAFEHFCGGESIAKSEAAMRLTGQIRSRHHSGLFRRRREVEEGFDLTTAEIIRTIEKARQDTRSVPFSVFKVTGLASFALLEKVNRKERPGACRAARL